MQKSILCFGDSNTHGSDPAIRGNRHPYDVRWTGRLQKLLGEEYYVIEEGQGGRTTVLEDPIEPFRNGRDYLPPCLATHNPIDLVIIMLGTNDIKLRFTVPASDVALGVRNLGNMVRQYGAAPGGGTPAVLVISPIYISEAILDGFFGPMYGERSIGLSHQLAPEIEKIARENGFYFLDAATVATPGEDGLHMGPESHAALAQLVADKVKEIFG